MRSCALSFKHLIKASYLLIILLVGSCAKKEANEQYEVVVIGEGTGAVAAAIQSARSGANTLLVSPYEWLGGMLTAAGVSATDGNHRLPAGLWGEFRSLLREHYGGADSLFTGWVSNTMFEPKIGARLWAKLAAKEQNLTLMLNGSWTAVQQNRNHWQIDIRQLNGKKRSIKAKVLIDGTDLGDVAAASGALFKVGMDARADTGEEMAPHQSNTILQDLTYTIILKDYGKNADKTIPRPPNYDPTLFRCACKTPQCEDEKAHDCSKMLSYGQLPNQKYMINWPKSGNDYYANVLEMNKEERQAVYSKAKMHSLAFIYFIQTELGYRHLGLPDDEFPTLDQLPFYPYHREGRRTVGLSHLTVNHILHPYQSTDYRTGIAVGDYPIDHHHDKNPAAPTIDFPKVPAFSIPMGCLIPKGVSNLLVADKAISVSNIVNGASRLQPVIIQVGQAAGLMAAMAVQKDLPPEQLDIREVQQAVLDYQGYLLPFIDVPTDDSHFEEIQRIAATGILRGKGVPYKWANQCWFYPDTLVDGRQLAKNLQSFTVGIQMSLDSTISIAESIQLLIQISTHFEGVQLEPYEKLSQHIQSRWEQDFKLYSFQAERPITKRELAVLLDQVIHPFNLKKIDFDGHFEI